MLRLFVCSVGFNALVCVMGACFLWSLWVFVVCCLMFVVYCGYLRVLCCVVFVCLLFNVLFGVCLCDWFCGCCGFPLVCFVLCGCVCVAVSCVDVLALLFVCLSFFRCVLLILCVTDGL